MVGQAVNPPPNQPPPRARVPSNISTPPSLVPLVPLVPPQSPIWGGGESATRPLFAPAAAQVQELSTHTHTIPIVNGGAGRGNESSSIDLAALGRKRSSDVAFALSPQTPLSFNTQPQQSSATPEVSVVSVSATPVPTLTSQQGTVQYISRLEAFSRQPRTDGPPHMVQATRIATLRDACLHDDNFYLCLHQIFCRDAENPLFGPQMGFSADQLLGFDALQTILLPNRYLPMDVVQFFSNFPYSDLSQGYQMPGQLMVQVKAFLSKLGRDWPVLLKTCMMRGYPTFALELRTQLSVGSSILQKVLFNAIHRHLAGAENATFNEMALKVFDQDQYEAEASLGRPGSLTYSQVEAKSRQLGAIYLSLRATFERQLFIERSHVTNPQPSRDNNNNNNNNGYVQSPVSAGSPVTIPMPPAQAHLQLPGSQRPPSQPSSLVNTTQAQHDQTARNVIQVGNHPHPPQRRRGRPPLSHNQQVPRSSTSSSALRSDGSNRAQAGPSSDQARMVSAGQVINNGTNTVRYLAATAPFQLLLPSVNQQLAQVNNPDPKLIALHQARLHTPRYEKLNGLGVADPELRLYQTPIALSLPPKFLGDQCPCFDWSFDISAEDIRNRVTMQERTKPDALQTRKARNGSLLWRLRCAEVPAGITSISEESWITRETSWPSCVFITLNDVPLEIRRKVHHGKDLALDLTNQVRPGANSVRLSIFRAKQESPAWGKTMKCFAVAIEAVEIVEYKILRDMPKQIDETDALASTLRGIGKAAAKDDAAEDDLQIVDAHLSIDITDPFTATVFEVPVRGNQCLHRECFDLDTFLQTRKARTITIDQSLGTPPLGLDDWKCPICKKDARPQMLVVDGFLKKVREDLRIKGQLGTKAILLHADGTWEPKKDTTDSGAVSTGDVEGSESREGSTAGLTTGVVAERWMGQVEKKRESVIIELD